MSLISPPLMTGWLITLITGWFITLMTGWFHHTDDGVVHQVAANMNDVGIVKVPLTPNFEVQVDEVRPTRQ
jgi:hypothetical protein